eukprot:120869_1
MAPFFWMLHYFGYLRADSLEEVVGLDIGYTGGFQKHRAIGDVETEAKMEDYLKEYEHRKREKAYLKNREHPMSSVHQESLHGNSYHGRKIITTQMIESLDANGSIAVDNSSTISPSGSDGNLLIPQDARENSNPSMIPRPLDASAAVNGHVQERTV